MSLLLISVRACERLFEEISNKAGYFPLCALAHG